MLQNLKKVVLPSRAYANAVAVEAVKPTVQKTKVSTETSHKKKLPLITCKRKEFNLLVPEREGSKFGSIPLASKGWLHYKSKDDFFNINPTVSAEQLEAQMQNLEEFLASNDFQLDEVLLQNLKDELDIKKLTDIQSRGMPKIADSNHVLLAAETGCGKTLAYLLPIVQQVLRRKQSGNTRKMNTPLALIITPGRELATQIGGVAQQLCSNTHIGVKTVLGGNTKRLMMDPEFEDVDILVATIGALSKLVTTGIYRVDQVRHLVLDEADTLLDDSFIEKLTYLLRRFPLHRNHMQDDQVVGTQLVLASATMPNNVATQLQQVLDVQTLHQVVSQQLHRLMPHVEQRFRRMAKADRPAQLLSLVKTELARKRPLLIFSNKSASCDYISLFLNNSGVNCLNLNGDMLMKIRLGRFEQFQRGECDVLSTTDVASRGLDTRRTRHVVNFDFPLHISDYIHRSGRIGRVGSLAYKSLVTNFISSRREVDVVQRIEHAARTGGLLPDVNANIKNLINQRIMDEMQLQNPPPPVAAEEEEAF